MKTPPVQRAASRKKLAAANQALPDGSFPVPTVAYLKKAIRAVGRAPASKRPALKALIRKRAKELGAMNTPGVKGTWAFHAANHTEGAVTLAMPAKLPMVRGAADIQVTRTGPGALNVMHKTTGTKVGVLASDGSGKTGWAATHASGKKLPAAPSVSGALAGLIAYHNRVASGTPPPQDVAATAEPQGSVDLATPAASASDGPKVTTMGSGKKTATVKPAVSAAAAKLGLSAEAAVIYAKLVRKGMSPGSAKAFAKRGAAMNAKKAAKAA